MTQARVFTVTQQDVDIAPDVVIGIISVFDLDAHILVLELHTLLFLWGLFQI